MWFLCGSAWFQQCQSAGTSLFRLGQTLKNNVVPLWFHVVPTMMTWIPPQASLQIMWFLCGSTWFRNAETRVLQPPTKPFSAGCGPLLDAGSALTKGGQVMFCPRPLHQLPKLPSHVVPECAACLEKQSGQTDPLLKFYAAGGATCRRPVCP